MAAPIIKKGKIKWLSMFFFREYSPGNFVGELELKRFKKMKEPYSAMFMRSYKKLKPEIIN